MLQLGTGRRKTSVARIRMMEGTGNFFVNSKTMEDYFHHQEKLLQTVRSPLAITNLEKNFDVHIKVDGGGITGQAEAIRHGLSRALVKLDANLRLPLRRAGFLTRDSRMKERKKYGLKGARAAYQFSKR
ncbi:MAG: 30S ribosomal protein S9 [Candidatus Wallbacteria bacterium]|nr:30S ribosomal protein S9 [Candidatus Wallbacteria bacterium]